VCSSDLIENCVFTGNRASSGGGMACRYSSPTIRGCSFIGNDAISDGAGLYVLSESEPLIEDCLFTGNAAEADGGAIYFTQSSGIVRDCLFTHNLAGFWGAGIYCQSSSSLDIRTCTFCLNDCHGDGSGICASSGSSLTVEQSIIAFNTGAPGISTLAGGDPASIEVLCCDVYGHPEDNYGGAMLDQTGLNDNISADPCFCDLASDAYTLWNYSPCAQTACGTIGAYPVACWDAQGVADSGAGRDAGHNALRAFTSPNPFRQSTSIQLTSLVPGIARITILDMAGREVRSLAAAGTDRGASALTWDGRDRAGQRVPAGVYWVRARQGDREAAVRVMAIR
jgi:predicted outer membrane repeat protein